MYKYINYEGRGFRTPFSPHFFPSSYSDCTHTADTQTEKSIDIPHIIYMMVYICGGTYVHTYIGKLYRPYTYKSIWYCLDSIYGIYICGLYFLDFFIKNIIFPLPLPHIKYLQYMYMYRYYLLLPNMCTDIIIIVAILQYSTITI